MDTGLKGKTVLVTGASRNMGRVASMMFAREGANLAICTSAKMGEMNKVADAARALGVTVVAEKCDVTDSAAVAAFVKKARDKFGGVDVAVNLAGNRAEKKFLDQDFEDWQRNIAVNLTGPYNICRNVIPLMMERRWGRIINISGISPYLGGPAAKAMVKLGIVGFTRGLSREFAEYNITANCVGPGSIARTELDPDEVESTKTKQAGHKQGTAEQAVSTMLYLASGNAAFITGQCYLVNGGRYLQ